MKAGMKIKMSVDIAMTAALFACMAYILVGEEAHERIGTGLAALFGLHCALNRKWYRALFSGRYTPLRVFQTAVNMLCLVSMATAAVSGAAMSRYVFVGIPFLSGSASLARTVHMLSAYWGFVFISVHLGLHFSMIIGMMKNSAAARTAPRSCERVLKASSAAFACFGAWAFVRHDLLSYMTLRSQFVFFDFDRPLALFFLDYAAIMWLFAWTAHYARMFLVSTWQKRES